jgi:lysozyme
MKTPMEAVLLILSWEQLRLAIYPDASPKRYPTGGWGHKLSEAEQAAHPVGSTISRDLANAWFTEDLEAKERGVARRLAEHAATDFQLMHPLCFGALVSLAYNTGADGLGDGLLAAVRNDRAAVPDWIKKYKYSGGKVLPGLVERRAAEAAMWQRGMSA